MAEQVDEAVKAVAVARPRIAQGWPNQSVFQKAAQSGVVGCG